MVSEAVLRATVGRMRHLGDITKIDGHTAPWVDCIIGGSPCQDLSIAGKRAGLAGARSGLFMEQIRIIKEMREASGAAYPRFMVWENVPGAFSSNKGQDFAAVLEETIRIVEPEAPDIEVPDKGWPTWGGYRDVDGRWSVAWRVLDAQYWGVPQRRRRIALVADFRGCTAAEILFERKSLFGDFAESGTERERPDGEAESGVAYAVRIRGGCDGGGKGALIQTEKNGTLVTTRRYFVCKTRYTVSVQTLVQKHKELHMQKNKHQRCRHLGMMQLFFAYKAMESIELTLPVATARDGAKTRVIR